MALDLLVTGFGPFPHVRVNPTERLARLAAASPRFRFNGYAARALILETSYAGGLPALAAALEAERPRAVLMLGLAAKARRVRVERFARASSSRLAVDAKGRVPDGARPVSNRATGLPLKATAPLGPALAALRRAGVGARPSPTAGRYLCNAGYHVALTDAVRTAAPTLFVHVPWLRPHAGTAPKGRPARFRPDPHALAACIAEIGLAMARRSPVPKRHV